MPMATPSPHPTIERIELVPLQVPFRPAVREAMAKSEGGLGMAIPAEEPWTFGDFVIARLTAEDGTVGVGEAFVWLPETGVRPEELVAQIEHGLSRYILGESPFAVDRMRRRMDDNVACCDVAKGLVDMACHDLAGHLGSASVSQLLGGAQESWLPLAGLIPLLDADAMADMARAFCDGGSRSLRLKLGVGIEQDVRICERVREAVGPDIRLRVDYNQAYSPDRAVQAIRAIAPHRIDCVEQPVRADDWLGMARVQRSVDVPVMAHEGCFTLRDQIALVELGAVRIVGINSERPGGITQALRAIELARERGLGVVIHNQPLGIASAMHVHLAAARYEVLGHDIELFGHVMFEDDLIVEPLEIERARIRVPDGPGLGVTLDEAALDRYATAAPTVLEQS
ncbi:MAG: mandelate racemase/muconate lactonizing enzyme family protein [Proteobacteria bacterium]|nr:mandelate racemase/muconate lactonizing enzyme family protein [Pseudomonadota bacterium]